jgi:O-antigen/teichoic acid export membrane protein
VNRLATLLLTGAAQAMVQLAAFAAGLFVIRELSAQQYAFYTIINAALGMMTVLTDSGIQNGLLTQGGAVWKNPEQLGAVLASALYIRRRLALLAMLLSVLLTLALLRHQGAAWGNALFLTASILPVFLATVSGHLYEAVPRLHQRLVALQRIQVASALLRVLCLALLLPLWPLAAAASLLSAVPQWLANWRLRSLAAGDADPRAAGTSAIRQEIFRVVRRAMPGAIYYSFSGQLNIWLISIFGHSNAVAAVGALSRLAMLLTVFTSVFAVLAVPRFARVPAVDPRLLGRRFWSYLGALALSCLLPLVLLAAFPNTILALLGPRYRGLTVEAVLMAGSAAAAVLTGAAFSLSAVRGIVASPWLAIPLFAALQIVLMATVPVDTVKGVVAINLFSSAGQFAFHCAYFYWAQRRRQLPAAVHPL